MVDAADLEVWGDQADAGAADVIRSIGLLVPVIESNGVVRLAFTNVPGLCLSLQALTNLVSGAERWVRVGDFQEISAGIYQFVDAGATSTPARSYRVAP